MWTGNNPVAYDGPGNTRCPAAAPDTLGGVGFVPCSPPPLVGARYVWVMLPGQLRQLSVCELQVLVRRPWVWRALSGVVNAAAGKAVAATSEYGYGSAYHATDGVATNDFSTETCVSTRFTGASGTPGAFQEVRIDLGAEYDVSSLELWPVLSGYSYAAGRTTGWFISVGASRNPLFNTPCSVPGDIAPPGGGGGSTTIACPARGRFVVMRRFWSAANTDDTVTFCEMRVWAAALLDHPLPRAGHAVAGFRGQFVVFGGYDAAGFRLNDLRFFDMNAQGWLPPTQPLGTPPVGRAYASLLPLGASVLQIFGGSGSTDALGDVLNVNFPPCPPLDLTGVSVGATACRHGGTDCTYACSTPAFVPYLGNAGLLTCMPDGSYAGAPTPLCVFATPPSVPPPAGVAVGPGYAVVSWSAAVLPPGSPPLSGYWVRPYDDGGQVEEYYLFTGAVLPARYVFVDPSAVPGPSTPRGASVLILNSALTFLAAPGSSCTPTAFACPMVYLNVWPSLLPRSDWAFETTVKLDDTTDGFNGYSAGIGIADRSGFGGRGALQFFLGLQRSWPFYTVTWASTSAGGSGAPWSFSNQLSSSMALGQSVSLRLERSSSTGGLFAAYYRTSPQMNWITLPRLAGPADMHNGSMADANMVPALVVRNTIAGGSVIAAANFAYFKLGPLNCVTAGPTFKLPPSASSVNITGLTQGATYAWGVQASSNGGLTWGSYTDTPFVPIPFAPARPFPPPGLVEVARGKPATQSSTLFSAFASLANDGSTATAFYGPGGASNIQCASTAVAASSATSLWWQVDLGISTDVEAITIYNSADRFPEWLTGFTVYASDTPDFNRGSECPSAATPFTIGAAVNFSATFPCAVTARYITVHSPNSINAALQLCEVQVWASNACPARAVSGSGSGVVSGSCGAGAPYSSPCILGCGPGSAPFAGAPAAVCRGSSWSGADLVCAPLCPAVATPPFTASCARTLLSDDFSRVNNVTGAPLAPSQWEPLYSRQAWGSHWFVANVGGAGSGDTFSYITASARHGCNNGMVLQTTRAEAGAWGGSFTISASVLALDTAGLAFRISGGAPAPSYYRFVGDRCVCGVWWCGADLCIRCRACSVCEQLLASGR